MENWSLIAKYLSGEASPEEVEAFEQWLEAKPENKQAYEEALLIWNTDFAKQISNIEEQDTTLWESIEANLQQEEIAANTQVVPLWSRYRSLAAAAAIALIALLSYTFWPAAGEQSPAPVASNDVVTDSKTTNSWTVQLTAEDSVDVFELPDHSLVWLKQGSSLSYSQEFGKEQRRVIMEGEAFFDVKRDTLHPFIIQTGVVETRVLGTQFQVAAKDNGDVSVEVESGKVSVQLATDLTNEPAILEAGDAVLYQAGEANLVAYDPAATKTETVATAEAKKSTKKRHWRHQKAPSTVAERLRPERFLSIEPHWKLNTVRLTVVEGKVTNTATKTSYTDVVLLVQHTSEKNGKVVTKKIALDEVIRPGESIEFKKSMMIDWFRNPAEVEITLVSASTTEDDVN